MLLQRDSKLEAALSACISGRIGRPVHAFQRVASTMEIAHALAAEGVPEGALVWAARQDQGKGRLGRTWTSPDGGLYISIILRPTRAPAEIPQLSLVAGLAAAQAIQEHAKLFPSIRWPNDLLISGKKVGGILVEARDGVVVVGVGINVTTKLEDLPDTATSLAAAGDEGERDLCKLTGELCRRLSEWYAVWQKEGFAPIREALRPWMGHFGHPIHITAGASRFEGTASDLDESGRLLVRLDSGIVRAFEMGEVALLR